MAVLQAKADLIQSSEFHIGPKDRAMDSCWQRKVALIFRNFDVGASEALTQARLAQLAIVYYKI